MFRTLLCSRISFGWRRYGQTERFEDGTHFGVLVAVHFAEIGTHWIDDDQPDVLPCLDLSLQSSEVELQVEATSGQVVVTDGADRRYQAGLGLMLQLRPASFARV